MADSSRDDEAAVWAGSMGASSSTERAAGVPMSADTAKGTPHLLASSHRIARAQASNCSVESEGT